MTDQEYLFVIFIAIVFGSIGLLLIYLELKPIIRDWICHIKRTGAG